MNESIASAQTEVGRTLADASAAVPKATRRKSSSAKWLFGLIALAAVAGGGYWYWKRGGSKPLEFRNAKVSRGDIIQSVTANGQLTAVKNVQVGSQISGIITQLGADFNTRVKKDQVIAKIDPSTYERNLAQVDADLANAQAGLELAQFNYKRAKELFASKLISESDYTQAEVNLHQAEAVVKMRQANVERAKVDLERTVITAPIDGVVISRNVEEGQTVAASFNTPTLFLIANDLAKMQIEAAVSEADVGGVEEGQQVNFNVDAFPTRQFHGLVKQVRYQPITNQNVVTYTTIVEVNNADLKLRPGMTANASIIAAQRKDALRIPNSAFRFRPPEAALPKSATNALASSAGSSTNKLPNAIAPNLATSGPFAGLPEPPWTAERRRPTQEEREKYEATLTPEQRDQYRERMEQMRARFAQGGGGTGGFGGGGGFGGAGGSARASQEGPRTQTVYLLIKEATSAGLEKEALKAVTIKTGITDGTYSEVLEGLNDNDVVVIGMVVPEPAPIAMGPPGAGGPFGSPFGGGRRRF